MSFVDWAFLIARIEELPAITAEIVESPPLRDLSFILDPVVPPKV